MPVLLFSDAAQQYIATLKLENGCNLARKTGDLDRILIPFFGELPLEAIKRPETDTANALHQLPSLAMR